MFAVLRVMQAPYAVCGSPFPVRGLRYEAQQPASRGAGRAAPAQPKKHAIFRSRHGYVRVEYVPIVLERLGSQVPACGSLDPVHRARTCSACQTTYADRKRVKKRAKRLASPAARVAKCGSRSRAHKTRDCIECQSIHDRESYARRAPRLKRRRSAAAAAGVSADATEKNRLRARVWKHVPPESETPRSCFDADCDAERLTLIIEDADVGPQWTFACKAHRAAAHRLLANRVAELLEDRAVEPARVSVPARRLSFEDAIVAARTYPSEVLAEIRARAVSFMGLQLSEESPLYQSRFAALVAQLLGNQP